MKALEKNIAIARGEALAANLLASAAIRAALAITSNREEVLAQMSAFIDEVLNMSGPGGGDAHDEFGFGRFRGIVDLALRNKVAKVEGALAQHALL